MNHTNFLRIVLFIKPNERASWEKDRCRQQEVPFCNGDSIVEWEQWTGILQRYPKQDTDLFSKDWFRFIDLQNNTLGDVYISFDLHAFEEKEKLFVIPNENSGGLDFTFDEKIVVDGKIRGKPDLRWVPLPLSDIFPIEKPDVKTYIVLHHPEEVCKTIYCDKDTAKTAPFDTMKAPPVKFLSKQRNILLTGRDVLWCERQFSGENDTLELKSFFQFIQDHPPT